MTADNKFKAPETALQAAKEFFKEKFEYKGDIGIEKKSPASITFYAKNNPEIEESFIAPLTIHH